MRAATIAFAVSLLALLAAPIGAGANDTAGDAAAVAHGARFAYVVPTAVRPAMRPSLERFADDLQSRIAAAAGVQTVPFRGLFDAGQASANVAAICTAGLPAKRPDMPATATRYVGFIAPRRSFDIDGDVVTSRAFLSITDCSGNLFYEHRVTKTGTRMQSLLPQDQIDALQASAVDELVADFTKYRTAHIDAWNRMLATGSAHGTASV